MMIVLKFLMFIASSLGYVLASRRLLKLNVYLSWIFSFSLMTMLLYLTGFIGYLQEGVSVIFVSGLVLLMVFWRSMGSVRQLLERNLNIVTLWFVGFIALMGTALLATKFIHYDNFSHWGLIVKYLLIENRYPDADAALISFFSYPIGSSLFVYYFSSIVGHQEGVMLLGQFLLIAACFYAWFAVVKDTRRGLVVGILLSILTITTYFNISIRMNNLLVDYLLPLFAIAAIAGIYKHRDSIVLSGVYLIVVLSMLSIIKNSGLFFTAVVLIYYAWLCIRSAFLKKGWSWLTHLVMFAAAVILSLGSYGVWDYHVDTVYGDAASKHDLDAGSYETIYEEKTPEIIDTIIVNYQEAIVSSESLSARGIILCNVLVIGYAILSRVFFRKKSHMLPLFIVMNGIAAIYYIGILLMFIVSMPTEEALVLAGFERYASSMVVFMLGLIALVMVRDIDGLFYEQDIEKRNYASYKSVNSKAIYQGMTVLALYFSIAMVFSEVNGMNYISRDYEAGLPARLKNVMGDRWDKPSENRYLIIANDNSGQISNYYVQYMGKYYSFSDNVDALVSYDMDDQSFVELVKKYDYVVVVEDNYSFIGKAQRLLNFTPTAGVYDVESLISRIE